MHSGQPDVCGTDASVVWSPSPSYITLSTLSTFVRYVNDIYAASIPIGDQNALHRWSILNPHFFWLSVAKVLSFPLHPFPAADCVLRKGASHHGLPALVDVRWFPMSHTNVAEALLRYSSISPHSTALIYYPESAADDHRLRTVVNFASLCARVLQIATALRRAGVKKGDSVSAVLPNIPQTVFIMLAVAAVGAVWSCCSPDFGVDAISARLTQTKPVVMFYAPFYRYKKRSCSVLNKIEEVVRHLPSLRLLVNISHNVAFNSDNGLCQLVNLFDFVRMSECEETREFEFTPICMDDPVVTMFSSGTTGAPKCIVQGPGIVLNQMKEHSLHLEITSDSVVFFNTTTSWMLHNWLVAVLATGASIILYDGAPFPPDDSLRLIRIAKNEKVSHFGIGAAYLRALQTAMTHISGDDVRLGRNSSVKTVLATGSPSTADHFQFALEFFPTGTQYVSMSGGTDINGCFALGSPWKHIRVPELSCAGLGMDVAVLDDDGKAIVGECGELVCRNACPCMPLYFAHDIKHSKYRSAYFDQFGERIWSHGDFAIATATGGFIISGRSDSTLNPGGVRMGTADIYQAVESIKFVSDTLVTEIGTDDGDAKLVMFVSITDDLGLTEERRSVIRLEIRKKLSPRHVPHSILEVSDIPYTFSGKKCEVPVKNLLNRKKDPNKEGVKNPEAFDTILHATVQAGLLQDKLHRCKL